jgi:hypothetical protein
MIFFSGGAAAGLMQVIAAQQRYATARSSRPRAMRVALQKTHERNPDWTGPSMGGAAPAPVWETFDCYHLCRTCGYLSATADDVCPGCGQRTWLDLRSLPAADALRQLEHEDRLRVPPDLVRRSQVAAGVVGAGLGIAAALATHGQGTSPIWSAVLGLVILGGVLPLVGWPLARLWTALRFRRRPRFPSRWRLPLPQGTGAAATIANGQAVPRAELLTAPVSGRPCIGYELTVLFDTPGDLRPAMWLLEEERTIPFAIGGVEVPADRATLDLPRQAVNRSDGTLDAELVTRLLRQRGLFTAEGDYLLHESIIEPGARYTLARPASPAGAVLVIRPE